MPNEYTRVTVSLSLLDQRIRTTQESIMSLQSKGLPIEDAEQTLIALLEARRLLEARMQSSPGASLSTPKTVP